MAYRPIETIIQKGLRLISRLSEALSLPPRIQALVQDESLFNDATSLLLFRIALSVAIADGGASWGHTLAEFGMLVVCSRAG